MTDLTPQQVIGEALHAANPNHRRGALYDRPQCGCQPDARTVLAALAEHGLVIVQAEDIRSVLGPDPGLMAYIEGGRRLLAAIEPPTPTDDKETSNG